MDTNYRSQVVGSPYVDEGFADRLWAKTASAKQAFAAMRGDSIQPHEITQIQQLWKSFNDKVADLLKNWPKTSTMLQQRNAGTLTAKQKREIKNWDVLYSQFVSIPQSIAGTVNPPKRAGSEYVKDEPVAAPKAEPYKPAMVAEAIYPRLLMALASNNTDSILKAFQDELSKMYRSFISDASKLTGKPEDQIVKAAQKLGGDIKKKITLLRSKILGIKAQKAPAAAATTAPSPATPPSAPTAPVAAPTASTGSAATPSTGSASTATTSSAAPTAPVATPAPASTGDISTDPAMATAAIDIISRVVDIIIDTVRADKEHSDPFMGKDPASGKYKKPLPTGWNEPLMTTNPKDDKASTTPAPAATGSAPVTEADAPAETPKSGEAADFEPQDGKFVYNFHGYYRKERSFNIPLNSPSIPPVYTDHKGQQKHMEVIWQNANHQNNIWVKLHDVEKDPADPTKTKKGTGSKNIKLFTFFDDEVNPRNDLGKKFSIEKIYAAANPSKNPFPIADKSKVAALNAKQEDLLRAFYATVSRKSMEFKAKKKDLSGVPSLPPAPGATGDGKFKWDEKGTLFLVPLDKKGKPTGGAPIKVNPGSELEKDELISIANAGYRAMFPTLFDQLKIKAATATTPKPTAATPPPAAPAAPTTPPPTPKAPEAPKVEPAKKLVPKEIKLSEIQKLAPGEKWEHGDIVRLTNKLEPKGNVPMSDSNIGDFAVVVDDTPKSAPQPPKEEKPKRTKKTKPSGEAPPKTS